jgi:hypothetical protein
VGLRSRTILCRSAGRHARDLLLPVVLLAAALGSPPAGLAELPETIRRLPPIEAAPSLIPGAPIDPPALLLARDPAQFRAPEEVLPPQGPALTSHKQGFFQKLSYTGTQVFRDGSGGLGIFENEFFAAFALPAPTTDTPLVIIPALEWHLLDGPSYVDLPARLYATYLDFMWLPKVGDRLRGIVSVAPGWYSDFEGGDGGADEFRLTGRGIARYDCIPDQLQLVLGVVYLNRHHNKIIPAAGVIWKPSEDYNFELVFPKAKIARRLSWGPGFEHWVYLTGGFGGNNWSILGTTGDRETLIMKDWRVTLGWERKMNGGAGFLVEVGYVFQREIELPGRSVTYYPDDTLLLRGGFAF